MTHHSDEVVIYPLSEARTCGIRNDPSRVVLMLRSGDDERHYIMSLHDFAGFARRLSHDARLLA